MNLILELTSFAARARRRFAALLALIATLFLLVIGAFASAEITSPAQASDPGTGAIAILAWQDANGDRLVDEGESRVANVKITVRQVGGGGSIECITTDSGEVCSEAAIL